MFGTLFKEKSLISMVIHVDTTNGSNLMWFIMPCTMTLFGYTFRHLRVCFVVFNRLTKPVLLQLLEGFAHEFAAGGGALCLDVGEDGSHVLHLRFDSRLLYHSDDVAKFWFLGEELL